jgi:hypothetical protein
MKENKNIERLFQEKFKDFEVSPPDFVWENIQEKLNPKEKKRRVIPFWYKTAGIAASFVAIVSVVFFNLDTDIKKTNSNNNNNNIVISSETNKENNTTKQNVEADKFNDSNSNQNQNNSNSSFTNEVENQTNSNTLVNNNSKNGISGSKTDSKFNKGSLQKSNTNKSNNSFVSNNKKQTSTTTYNKNKTQFNNTDSGIVSNRSNRIKNSYKLKSNAKLNDFNSAKNNSSNSEITDLNTINKSSLSEKNIFNSSSIDFSIPKNNSSNSEIKDINSTNNSNSNSGLVDIKSSNSSNLTTKTNTDNNAVIVENGLGNSDSNSTTVVAIEELKTDTITLATVTIGENPMEKLLREKETKKVVDEKEKWSKWAVNSYVSPVFFNSFASGSPISDEFASNKKTFNNSTSYGVGVAYNLNKRLAIKTGVSNLNLDYDTENIAFYSSFEDQSKIANTNIERNSNGKYLFLKHEKDISKNAIENQIYQSSQNLGNLNQRTQYIEVPLELSYAIVNKKIGVAIKGGMSTLFLTENEVSIKAIDGNMQIGKASNLNSVHFSSNLGLGVSYNFMKNLQLNVEPTLKYQINTFNKNSEDFTPYVIGVNTGISYKF